MKKLHLYLLKMNKFLLYIILIEDEATLKRVYLSKGKITLAAANDAYEPLVYIGPETERVRIIGRAVAFLSRVR